MEETTRLRELRTMRPPFTDVSNRINSCQPHNTEWGVNSEEYTLTPPEPMAMVTTPLPTRNDAEKNCFSPVIDSRAGSKRNSAVSAASAASIISGKGKRKTHVGPWQLGRTLGSGATGRVRLAKHAATGQTVAIKIVSKKCAAISQSDSIIAMNKNAGNFVGAGTRQMPSGIEREVVIMKLIEHPNVISLYDVWENRGELYLVLEYVEGGELFDYVSKEGPLPEEEAVRLFRQIIAGLGYCHRFNICHRDLKPENILLDANHNIKLADFGMAALQPAGHWLNTSCGSPHYAAPEIIYGRKYRGDKADIWSCGIILYALLTGFLPFDGGDLHSTLQLVWKGDYMIPPHVSDEAADLIQRILQKKPDDRITMREIWKHPLLKKYEKFHQAICNHHLGPAPPLSPQDCGPPVIRQDIDVDLLRNLQTLWHDVKPEQLIERLLSLEPTQERMFYYALLKFRNEQLENYQGQQLKYSASDYHHISRGQARLSKYMLNRSHGSRRRLKTPAVKETGKRRPSKEPKSSCTVESYDTFRPSFNRTSEGSPEYAQVATHRHTPASYPKQEAYVEITASSNPFLEENQEDIERQQSLSFTVVRKKRSKVNSVKSFHSKASLSGSRRGLTGTSTPRSASYKRGVSFRHNRNRSQGSKSLTTKIAGTSSKRHPSEGSLISVYDDDPFSDRQGSPMLPDQPTVVRGAGIATKTPAPRREQHSDVVWKDDARKVSNELSQICEEAFNGSSLSTGCTYITCVSSETPATSVSIASPGVSNDQLNGSNSTVCLAPRTPGDSPKFSNASKELEETRRRLIEHSSKGGSKDISAYLARVISHIDQLIEQEKTTWNMAQNEGHSSKNDLFAGSPMDDSRLPIISEELSAVSGSPVNHGAGKKRRHVSDSTAASSHRSDISRGKRSIRIVPQSSIQSISNADPLKVGKQRSLADEKRILPESEKTQHAVSRTTSTSSKYSRNPCELDPIDEHQVLAHRGNVRRSSEHKKWSLFRKSQNIEEDAAIITNVAKPLHSSAATANIHETNAQSEKSNTQEHKSDPCKASSDSQRSSFWRFMKRKTSKNSDPEPTNPLLEHPLEVEQVDNKSKLKTRRRSPGKSNNWFARVFQFKPATRVVALKTSEVKGCKEVYRMLVEYQQYGIEDVRLDKPNSIIYGRVGESNVFHLRPVEFSAVFYTVIEAGRREKSSLIRFQQEHGAASSFHKVVDTLCIVMKQRGLLVEEPGRAKEMILRLPNT
ncbi:hypothetical protein BJX63DRAFT_444972 [Aspergillus granulosus]|uniref:non-specific serine/threonine protein kinase n=1 Tax=Aspergillus granulosus TaxID=176169 RepID=A0ABR4HWZ2_9EURO